LQYPYHTFYSGSNTDCKSSEPLKTIVMLCYVINTVTQALKALYVPYVLLLTSHPYHTF